MLNEQPDTTPHVLIAGPTGSGKTTFAMAVLSQRQGLLCIITPKADDTWGGMPFTTLGDDLTFNDINRTLNALDYELKHRHAMTKHSRNLVHVPLTIVIDDFPVIVDECGDVAVRVMKTIARLGRSLRVRLVVLSQSTRVKSLGLSGEGDTRDNFAIVSLTRQHRASVDVEGVSYDLDTRKVSRLARRGIGMEPWSVPVPVPEVPENGIEPVPEPVPGSVVMPDTEAVNDGSDNWILTLLQAGHTRNEIVKIIGGNRANALAKIRHAAGE